MSDWHDVENNLAFPPRENITSNNLTENLVEGIFYYTSSGIERCHICTVNGIKEVVTPKGSVWQAVPSYDHFVELTDKVEEFKKDIQTLTNNYKLLEKKQASDIAHGQALVDEFGDFEVLYEELQRLRKIAAKYDHIKVKGNYPDKISQLKSRIKHLLELQDNQDKELESSRWYQTIQNEDIAKLRELLKECYERIPAHPINLKFLDRINEALNV